MRPLPRPDERARAATYPPPYPNAWYLVARSSELGRGDTLFVECFGEALALFRGGGDRVAALQAYCQQPFMPLVWSRD